MSTVNPVQSSTYTLSTANNPITFGVATDITAGTATGVLGTGSTYWNVTTKAGGVISSNANGVYLGSKSKLTNAAKITAGHYGVVMSYGGVLSNTGYIYGASGGIEGARNGYLSVTNAGTIRGDSVGAYLLGAAGITNKGSIFSYNWGIYAKYAAVSVTNTGSVFGQGSAITLLDGGTVSNKAGGYIKGDIGWGVYLGQTGTVTNAGRILGADYGVMVMGKTSTVTNSSGGYIYGIIDAVDVFGATSTVTNTAGQIVGYVGVRLNDGGKVTNSGTITGDQYGIYAKGAAATVTNTAGEIKGEEVGSETDAGVGVRLTDGGTVTNGASAKIEGYQYGVYISGAAGTVMNSGGIYGVDNNGVYLRSGGSVNNSGKITGAFVAISTQGAVGSINNSGYVLSSYSDGLYVGHGGSLINTGTINGSGDGVHARTLAMTLTNSGTIAGTGSRADAINLEAGGQVTNQAGGVISGDGFGVSITGAIGKVSNTGTINGGAYAAVRFGAAGSVANNHNIYGLGPATNGIELQAGGSVINAGRIEGHGFGVNVTNGAGGVTNNAGAVIYGFQSSSGGGAGVALADGGMVTNKFYIYGYNDGVDVSGAKGTLTNGPGATIIGQYGTGVLMSDGGNVTNNLNASIEGAGAGVSITGDSGVVTNFGLISGSIDSVAFSGGGKNSLALQTGSSLIGMAVGSTAAGATNVLSLTGHGVASNVFDNFTSLTVAASGGAWVMEGVSSINGSGIVTTGTLQVGDTSHTGASLTLAKANNSGVLDVEAGLLHITGGVIGTGTATINAGALQLDSTFTENVTFDGSSGELTLGKSKTYTGTVKGFAAGDTLDLRDIKFLNAGEATYASGMLTVNGGGSDIAKITLFGSYMASFTAASDGAGGTLVTYTPPPQPALVIPGH